VGCYSSSPLKQNLVPRFLSVAVRGAKTKLELGLNGGSSNSQVILWVASKTCFCRRCRSSSFPKVDGSRVDVAESILSKPHRDICMVSGVRLSGMPEMILRELEGFQLAIEVLKSWGFSGSFCWLGVVASFVYPDGIFKSLCRALKMEVGVDPSVLSLECYRGCR
jgi:hypothetical protein